MRNVHILNILNIASEDNIATVRAFVFYELIQPELYLKREDLDKFIRPWKKKSYTAKD
jgi:hypothetical protein